MNYKKELTNFFQNYKRQINVADLIKKLNISLDDTEDLLNALFALEQEGLIYYDKDAYMHVPKDFIYKHGILKRTKNKKYYVELNNHVQVYVKNTFNAPIGSLVFVEINKKDLHYANNYYGTLNRVIKREKIANEIDNIIEGPLKKEGHLFSVTNKDTKIYIAKENLNNSFPGDIVSVITNDKIGKVKEIIKRKKEEHVFKIIVENDTVVAQSITTNVRYQNIQSRKNKYQNGDIILAKVYENYLKPIKKISHTNDINTEVNALLTEYGFANTFDIEIEKEAEELIAKAQKEPVESNRIDLTNLETFTIDPLNDKDLDDAISLVIEDNMYHLYVHTANPSHFIKLNSKTFKEALERSFSVYPTNGVIPMLPEQFSNGLCSLNEFGVKYALTCRLDIDKNGKICDFEIFKSLIKSNKQMNYDEVNKIFHNKPYDESYTPFINTLYNMLELSEKLNYQRQIRGSLTFEKPEREFILDENNNPVGLVEKEKQEAEKMVENFMLLANETTATFANYLGLIYLYRNHEKPTVQKSAKLNKSLQEHGYLIQKISNIDHPKILQNYLTNILKDRSKEERKIISCIVLKSMTRAYYNSDNVGHYGLALDCYGTFTSPARKISDFLNHVCLEAFLDDGLFSEKLENIKEFITDIGPYISERQKDAEDLENELDYLFLKKYSSNLMYQEVKAHVLFINKGLIYVKDEHGLIGTLKMDRMTHIKNNYIYIDNEEYNLLGCLNLVLIGKKENKFIYSLPKKELSLTKIKKEIGA